jgi:broad specificity phosphatase PhoE
LDLYLIRHAQSTNNALTNRMDRGHDPPLTELGQQQAQCLAEYLGGRYALADGRPLVLYVSPMWRTLQTTAPAAAALGVTPEVWTDIYERGGVYSYDAESGEAMGAPGKTRAEMTAEFPGYVLPPEVGETGWWHGSKESREAAYARAIHVARLLRARAEGNERIFLVTHGGFMDFLIKALFNQMPSEHMFYYNRNASISHLRLNGDGRLLVYYLNRVGHLPPELLT